MLPKLSDEKQDPPVSDTQKPGTDADADKEPVDTKEPAGGESPQTGMDERTLWIVCLIGACVGLIGLILQYRFTKKRD